MQHCELSKYKYSVGQTYETALFPWHTQYLIGSQLLRHLRFICSTLLQAGLPLPCVYSDLWVLCFCAAMAAMHTSRVRRMMPANNGNKLTQLFDLRMMCEMIPYLSWWVVDRGIYVRIYWFPERPLGVFYTKKILQKSLQLIEFIENSRIAIRSH